MKTNIQPLPGHAAILSNVAKFVLLFAIMTSLALCLQRAARMPGHLAAALPALHMHAQKTWTILLEHAASGLLIPLGIWGVAVLVLCLRMEPTEVRPSNWLARLLSDAQPGFRTFTAWGCRHRFHAACVLVATAASIVCLQHEGRWELKSALFMREAPTANQPTPEDTSRIKVLKRCLPKVGQDAEALIACMRPHADAELQQLDVFSGGVVSALLLVLSLHAGVARAMRPRRGEQTASQRDCQPAG